MQQNTYYTPQQYRPPTVMKYEVQITWKFAWGLLWRWLVIMLPAYLIMLVIVLAVR